MRKRRSFDVKIFLVFGLIVFASANFSFAGTVDLHKTGQTTCYDVDGNVISCAGTGEDGEIQAGVAWPDPRFTDNGDGTVTDNLTGLMWLKNGNISGLVTWQAALERVSDLNANPDSYAHIGYTGSYSDWALPNVNELLSLANAEVLNSATWLNEKGFIDVQSGALGTYWSSTTASDSTDIAWVVDLGGGLLGANLKEWTYCAWPVRAATSPPAAVWKTGQTQSYAAGDDGALQRGVAWPEPRFVDNGDGTVTDNLTGLIWLKDANCFGLVAWQAALEQVADLNVMPGNYSCEEYTAEYRDWRLPNREELHSLTDFSQSALPAGHPFSNVQSNYYWSSTTSLYLGYTEFAWVVGMQYGNVLNYLKSDGSAVWPVRAGHSGSLVLDIKANGSDGPISVKPNDPVAISISLDPGNRVCEKADWWIARNAPVAPPENWTTYVYPTGWMTGLNLCVQTGLFNLASHDVLNMTLPVGSYTFYFALDNPDGKPTGPWWGLDSVVVNVN